MIVLYQARMRTSQKISLGIFLCLSLIMVCLAIIRASKIHGAVSIDVVWAFFWQFMETVVAVTMGSLTVVRNLLVHQSKSNQNSPAAPSGPPGQRSLAYRMRLLRRKKAEDLDDTTRDNLPQVPGATLTGLRTFIRRNHRDPGLGTQVTQASTLVDDESYQLMSMNTPIAEEPEHNNWRGQAPQHAQRMYYQVRVPTFGDNLTLSTD